jgi:hypothetical protein
MNAGQKTALKSNNLSLESARRWLQRGFHPIPVPDRGKAPKNSGWPSMRLRESDLAQHFNGRAMNIGIILGIDGAADVDCDCPEALAAAPILLPDTGMIFGRASTPAAHHLYRSNPAVKSMKYIDPLQPRGKKATIVELRGLKQDGSVGIQTVVPTSMHPSNEKIRFEPGRDGEAATVQATVLEQSVGRLAAAALLARHFPEPKSGRNDAFLALAGILARARWKSEDAVAFNFALYRILFGPKADRAACSAEVKSTFMKHGAGEDVTGIPKLKTLVREQVVMTALDWLGINPNSVVRSAGQDDSPSVFDRLQPYPETLGEPAYYGLAGKFVRMVEPHTEADPSLLLLTFLVYAGNILGRDAYVWAGGDKHHTNLFVCAVGPSATGRKGSAASPVKMFFNGVDPKWVKNFRSGLSSGEGIVWAVHDPITRIGKNGEIEEIDHGIEDKRLLVLQTEFFGALRAMKRQGNTLSATIRDAWDRDELGTLVKNNPAKATNPHISIIANITGEELLRGLLDDELDNGFANRFLWVCSKQSKFLPEGGRISTVNFDPLRAEFNKNRGIAKGAIERNADARDMWGYDNKKGGVYRHLSRDRGGVFGNVTSRAAPQVLRVSLIYALLDGSPEIRREHLEAALEVWRYAEESAAYIFGDVLGDPLADAIFTELKQAGKAGMTRTELTDSFGRNKLGSDLNRGLLHLHRIGKARFVRVPTAGRPTERWFAT